MIAFPKGRHNDQVDSTSQALKWFNYQPDEPALIQYYRELNEERDAERDEDDRIVALKCSDGTSNVYTQSGEVFRADADGLFRLPWRDAKPLLARTGWSLVEDPE